MKTQPLAARLRTARGTRACRKLRGAGEIPANLYATSKVDGKTEHRNVNLAVSAYDVMMLIEKDATLLDVSYEDQTELCQLSEVQRDVFGDDVLHIDLRLIDPNQPMQSTVNIVTKGLPKGVKEGGRLQVILHEVELSALPRLMPTEILIRLDDLGLLDSIHVRDLELPEGVTAVTDVGQLVAHVLAPQAEEEPADEEGGGQAEPEVISKGKQEE